MKKLKSYQLFKKGKDYFIESNVMSNKPTLLDNDYSGYYLKENNKYKSINTEYLDQNNIKSMEVYHIKDICDTIAYYNLDRIKDHVLKLNAILKIDDKENNDLCKDIRGTIFDIYSTGRTLIISCVVNGTNLHIKEKDILTNFPFTNINENLSIVHYFSEKYFKLPKRFTIEYLKPDTKGYSYDMIEVPCELERAIRKVLLTYLYK